MAFVRVRDRVTGQQKVLSQGMATALRDKYEIITEGVEKTEEVSTDQAPAPNVETATAEVADADEGLELANARAEYEKAFGEKPHGRLKLESIKKLISEKNAG